MKAGSVRLSTVRTEDGAELVVANLASLRYHEPWVYPCREPAAFQGYLKSCDGQRKIGFILRESAIFGILGVATLGYYVDAAISEFRLDVAVVLILVTALLSMAVDALSRGLRRRLRIDTMPTRLSEAPTEARVGRPVGEERLA